MGTFTNILFILLCILVCIHLGFNLYVDVIAHKENTALLNLQDMLKNAQADFINEKSRFFERIKQRDEYIDLLIKRNKQLEEELKSFTDNSEEEYGEELSE